MLKIEILPEAEENLIGIWFYTLVNFGNRQAEKYYSELKEKIIYLSEYPERGKKYKSHVKIYLANKHHKILYYVENNTLYVMKILHNRMNINKHFPVNNKKK